MEFLMKLHKFDPIKYGIGGWLLSEKLDGMRCFWDGGITRDMPKEVVPWANTAKDDRYVEKQVSTGLWTTYGNVIYAPAWWLDKLPNIFLDGELYIKNNRQKLMSIVKKHKPDPDEWLEVDLWIADSPPLEGFLMDRTINNANFKKRIVGCKEFFDKYKLTLDYDSGCKPYINVYNYLISRIESEHVMFHPQEKLPDQTAFALDRLADFEKSIYEEGGEGIVLRDPYMPWRPERSHNILKRKDFDDSECIVTGFTEGKGKYEGMIGALKVKWNGKEFELSGMKDNQRVKDSIPIGTIVTFRYRGLTNDGIPQEARFKRIRED